jgi:hypothetical protein
MTLQQIWPGPRLSEPAAATKPLKSEVGMCVKSLKRLGYSDLGFLIIFAQSKTRFLELRSVHRSFHKRIGDYSVI